MHEVFGDISEDESGEESESSSIAPLKMPPRGSMFKPRKEEVSMFTGERFIETHQWRYVADLWKGLLMKITMVPIDSLSSMRAEVFRVMEEIKRFDRVNSSDLEKMLATLFDRADDFDAARSKSSDGMTKESRALHLAEAESSLHAYEEKEIEEGNMLKVAQADLKQVEKDLEDLRKKKKALSEVLQQHQVSLQDIKGKTKAAKDNILAINNIPILEDTVSEDLKITKSKLEAAVEELKTLNPLP